MNQNSPNKLAGLLNASMNHAAAPNLSSIFTQEMLDLAMAPPPRNTLLDAWTDLTASQSEPEKWRYVINRFKHFQDNLALTASQFKDGETKFKGVFWCLNAVYRGKWASHPCVVLFYESANL
ncbi:hypothetical protein [Undibacterium parvum]|uniref:Uncharacterized protein n=2 Tax=Undibacterium TaxID=401469 RepID=A0A6M4A105_9BURK|nr:hypothetical protein [Undibacterium parvum]AZP14022.1 hypothetical protein EJN92_19695 [Undibacterium parvum]QJQ04971.1 hypothetical protein EJG51_002875 [Undibacterium piscinae]